MQPEELDLVNRIRLGDMEAFETVFRAHYSALCIFALKYLRRMDLAEEIVQDLFSGLWEKRTNLTVETSLKSYLFRAVHNNSLKYLQHQKVVNRHAAGVLAARLDDFEEPAGNLQAEEISARVEEAFREMPAKTREIFELSRNSGLKYGEIAERLGISIKTVEAHMGNALKVLREHLREFLPLIGWLIVIQWLL